jgi:hypothetical protein
MSRGVPTLVRYSELVQTDLANNAVNFADEQAQGHRVALTLTPAQLNTLFTWTRAVDSGRPIGHFNSASFVTALLASIEAGFSDIDGSSAGLDFSSDILNVAEDARLRATDVISANDLVVAYLLYKCYGKSAAATKDIIYNLADAHNMLTSEILVDAIETSLLAEEAKSAQAGVNKGAVDAMFRDLLAADPMRFFDNSGNQIAGLFETNADAASDGNWKIVDGDKIEISVEFTFKNSVTRRGVRDSRQQVDVPAGTDPIGADSDSTERVVIATDSTFKIRLQLTAVTA